MVWRFSRWQPSWISEWNDFSNSESLCPSEASHQILAQSPTWFGRCCLKNFKMAAAASWISEWNYFSNFESLLLWCLPLSFCSIQLTDMEISFEEFQDGRCGHLGYRSRTILAILNLYVAPIPSTYMPYLTLWQNFTEFWPFWTPFPIRFSNLTEFSYQLISYYFMKK